jgi:L-threonylcarbamoyladenylate synthase
MVFSSEVAEALQAGELAVIPTDTLYGIVCQAKSADAVEKLYRARGRDDAKPCIILIADISELKDFGIEVSSLDEQALSKHWPGKVSVVFDCTVSSLEEWKYLHRGTHTLAFRVPADEELRNLLRNTGPLLAPSANPEGKEPAHTVKEAKDYFGDLVSVYVDGGYRNSLPSTVARLENGVWKVLREGAVKFTPSPIHDKTN